jgi:hypothetical protein
MFSSLKIGDTLSWGHQVQAYTWGEDPNLIHVGEDFTVSDLEIGDSLEISYKPRLKPMKKFRGKEKMKNKQQYRKTKVKKLREVKKWRRKNKANLKKRAKMRHFKKRS